MGFGQRCETTGPSGQYWCSLRAGHSGNHKAFEGHGVVEGRVVEGRLLEEWAQQGAQRRRREDVDGLITLVEGLLGTYKTLREQIAGLEAENEGLRVMMAEMSDQLVSERAKASAFTEDLDYIRATEEL